MAKLHAATPQLNAKGVVIGQGHFGKVITAMPVVTWTRETQGREAKRPHLLISQTPIMTTLERVVSIC